MRTETLVNTQGSNVYSLNGTSAWIIIGDTDVWLINSDTGISISVWRKDEVLDGMYFQKRKTKHD